MSQPIGQQKGCVLGKGPRIEDQEKLGAIFRCVQRLDRVRMTVRKVPEAIF